jgi:hypothetical protein
MNGRVTNGEVHDRPLGPDDHPSDTVVFYGVIHQKTRNR